jgi:hypothetical protein
MGDLMDSEQHKDFDRYNRETLSKFIKEAENHQDDISGSVMATMTQFIMNLRITISEIGKGRDWLTPIEIIESQVKELRRCVIDLETYKERLTKGVTQQ